jgi:Crinkler effector protein N-terminal domain
MTELWCYIEGKRDYFGVTISPKSTIDNLKTEIYNKYVQFIVQCSRSDLLLMKVHYIMISMRILM